MAIKDMTVKGDWRTIHTQQVKTWEARKPKDVPFYWKGEIDETNGLSIEQMRELGLIEANN